MNKAIPAKDMDTQETNYNYFKKTIFFNVKRQFSPVYFPFLFFFKENQNNMLVQKIPGYKH